MHVQRIRLNGAAQRADAPRANRGAGEKGLPCAGQRKPEPGDALTLLYVFRQGYAADGRRLGQTYVKHTLGGAGLLPGNAAGRVHLTAEPLPQRCVLR